MVREGIKPKYAEYRRGEYKRKQRRPSDGVNFDSVRPAYHI